MLPAPIAALVRDLAALPGTVAVVLGGSRALGTNRPDSDWDLGLYYHNSQRAIDPNDLRGLGYAGHISALGEWGPIVNGGAWLTVADLPVDILFRDLDAIQRWLHEAEHGRFEILTQNGYIVGAPTYLPIGELAICQPITGHLPRPAFPAALADNARSRWQGRASVAMMFANGYAQLTDVICCAGMLANAILCASHARLAQRREWVINEKHLVQRAGLSELQHILTRPGGTREELLETVAVISAGLDIEPLVARRHPRR